MLEQINMAGFNKIDVALNRLKTFEPPEGYYLAFSGGKDSIVIKELCNMAGVKYDSHYNITTVDPPELVQYIRKYHPEVERKHATYKDGKRVTMFNLISRNKFPPTRLMRYCCRYLKEGGGDGRFVVTGVRWAESAKRKNNRAGLEVPKKGKIRELLDPDNPDNSEMARFCPTKGKNILNPIIDWEDDDVWEFIKLRKLPYCELYDQGYTRLGCIGCPMSTHQKEELERYPNIKKAYLRAFEIMLKNFDKPPTWKTGEDVMEWWLKE
ncbi:MAG: phosphoadenosine phosphosulfate reductase [Clostridia bacterium]|nr:phosphoadenosine phosphosulfate reductase [Clostridia bacterium]